MPTCIFTEVVRYVKRLVVVTDIFKVDKADRLCNAMQHERCNNPKLVNRKVGHNYKMDRFANNDNNIKSNSQSTI